MSQIRSAAALRLYALPPRWHLECLDPGAFEAAFVDALPGETYLPYPADFLSLKRHHWGACMPPALAAPDFSFQDAVMSGSAAELNHGYIDLGPTDSLTTEQVFDASDAFFGTEPLTTPPENHAQPPPSLKASSSARIPELAQQSVIHPTPTPQHAPTLQKPAPSLHETPAPGTLPSGNSKTRSRKLQARKRRKGQRREDDAKKPRYGERPNVMLAHVTAAPSTAVALDVASVEIASTGFVALPDNGGGVYGVDHLVNRLGFTYVEANGNRPRAITDSTGRVVAVYAGAPNDPSWADVCLEAFEALQDGASQCRFTSKTKKHRRGNFPALNAGISHGNGRVEPGNLTQSCDANTSVVENLLTHPSFVRIAGFASSAFRTWFPKLHAYYDEKFNALLRWKASLRRLFPRSVWAAVAFNFGPRTVSKKHRDFSNVPFGICAVTALGRFDYRRGGHMVFWQLKLVVEFPPSTTILLTSAIVSHSNTPLQQGEVRCSFAQYTAGGLIRWVDHGFQTDDTYFEGMDAAALDRVREENTERCTYGISLFSTLAELTKGSHSSQNESLESL